MLHRVVRVAVLMLGCLLPASARAQQLTSQIGQLFTFPEGCGDLICLANLTGPHGNHFKPAADRDGRAFIDFITQSIGTSVSNTPISSSSSGTTFRFEGIRPVATSTSGGPIFAERAQTLGRGRWFAGMGVTQLDFQRLRGVPLDRISFNFTHEDADSNGLGSPNFENDLIRVQVAMNVSLLVASFGLTYGLVDGVDLGVTVPFVRTSMSGTSVAQIIPANPAEIDHYFGGTSTSPVLSAVRTVRGSAAGLGDVEGHLKINVAQGDHVGVAVFGSARFPTGDENNLLGSGAFSGRGLGVLSVRLGQLSTHLNVGYTVRDAVTQNNSVDGALGYDVLVAPTVTMAFDVLSAWQIGASNLHVPAPVVYTQPITRTLDVTNIPSQPDNYMALSFGFKFRTRRGIEIVTNALFPLRDSGLQPNVAWTGALQYNF